MLLLSLLLNVALAATPAESLSHSAAMVESSHGAGSGAVVEPGYIITNWHVCRDSRTLKVTFEDDTVTIAPIVKIDPYLDLCAAKLLINRAKLPVAKRVLRNEPVWAHSWPHKEFKSTLGVLVSEIEGLLEVVPEENGKCPKEFIPRMAGKATIIGCRYLYTEFISTLFAAPGSSGSIVVNEDSEVVGVIQSSEGDSYSAGVIPLSHVQKFMKGL